MGKSSNEEVNLFISESTSSRFIQLPTEDYSLSEQRTISQISDLAKGQIRNVLATLSSIQTEIPWFYIGCITCSTKVTPYFNYVTEEMEPGIFSCDKCNRDKTTTSIRFKVQVRATNHTCSASLLLFDSALIKLHHKSANDLLEQQLELNHSGHVPQELLDLEGHQFVSKVKHTDTTNYRGSATYHVDKLTADHEITTKFEESCSSLTCGDSEIRHGLVISSSAIDQIDTTSYQSENKVASHNSNFQLSITTVEDTPQMSTPSNKRTINLADDANFEQSTTKLKITNKSVSKRGKK